MKCHYEVLDVSKDASDSDVKTAYRKLALKWHPDKNLENPELAKEQFQLVQQAYEVLSDRQERAWYDNHREQILRGSNSEFEDKSLDVFHYFNTSCFKGYEDDKKGFYAIYRNVFESIAKEDMEFMQDKEEFCEVPSFGNSQTDYQKVSEFYNYWLNYTTKKSYVWLDPYDITSTKDRRYVKLVEKENKKVRQKARKERNEEVRNLVAFVKKRDKRVQAQKKIQEQKSLENKKKRELLSKQKRLERQQELNESGSQPEWSKFDNFKSELEEIEKNLVEQFGEEFSNSEDEEEENDLSSLYCVACNKIFKTVNAFENHEFSKKHKENIVALKELMLNENDCDEELEDTECIESETNHEDILDDDVSENNIEMEDVIQTKSKKKKKSRNVLPVDLQETHNDVDKVIPEQIESEENLGIVPDKKHKKKNKRNSNKMKSDINEKSSEPENTVQANKKNRDKKMKKEIERNVLDIDTDHNCITCKSSFPSKNKLFDHLKKTGHGVYIPSNVKNK
ncbi:dnaJ homolog subfamily C member 21, partial [Anoplophora glabripennis]|uniref:dnaJ homolog subfamily C member 21 n=1 Tax=Anoplophora glabripennis TaxID=217634 RepID=UPI00087423B2